MPFTLDILLFLVVYFYLYVLLCLSFAVFLSFAVTISPGHVFFSLPVFSLSSYASFAWSLLLYFPFPRCFPVLAVFFSLAVFLFFAVYPYFGPFNLSYSVFRTYPVSLFPVVFHSPFPCCFALPCSFSQLAVYPSPAVSLFIVVYFSLSLVVTFSPLIYFFFFLFVLFSLPLYLAISVPCCFPFSRYFPLSCSSSNLLYLFLFVLNPRLKSISS